MEPLRYYPCQVRLDGDVAFVIWSSGDRDGFCRDENRRLVVAASLDALTAAGHRLGVELETAEVACYDFDRIRNWCARLDVASMDCCTFLNAWNFFDDLGGLHVGEDTAYAQPESRSGTLLRPTLLG